MAAAAYKLVAMTRGWQTGTDNNQLKAATSMATMMAMAMARGWQETGTDNKQLVINRCPSLLI